MHDYANQFNMKWKKIDFEAQNWYSKQQCLPIGHKKWAGGQSSRAGNCPPCPIGSAANICLFVNRITEKIVWILMKFRK